MMTDNKKAELRTKVLEIVAALEASMNAAEWINGARDIEYRISGHDRSYLGARICVSFGGPIIWVDTRLQTVEGWWQSDRFEATYSDENRLDEFCAGMFESPGIAA